MYHLQFLVCLTNVKTIILISLTYILFKFTTNRYSRTPRWYKFSRELPGPTIYPIIGCASTLLIGAKIGLTQLFTNYMKTYGSTFRVQFGKHLAVVVSDVDDVQTILTSPNCLEKKESTKMFRCLLGNSLPITSPAAVWKHKRKAYQPFYTKNNVLSRIQEMNEQIDKYIEKIQKQVDGAEFDLEYYMTDLSFDTIMKTHFNYDMSDEERTYLNINHRINEAFMRAAFNAFFPYASLKAIMQWLEPTDIAETVRIIHKFVDKVVNVIQKSSTWSEENEETESKTLKRETFVQSYIGKIFKLEKELNEKDLVHYDILATMAASDIIGYTLAFCILALAAHPEIQEKVYQEIYQVFGDDTRPIDSSDLNKFPYLEQVIKETQRLYTMLPAISRGITKDTKIGTRNYPAGVTVILNIGGIHHNPEFYPQPYRFNPENFSPEAIEKRHKYSFLPFSAGSRSCLGREYGEINMKLRLVSLLRMFTFHTTVKLENIKIRFAAFETSSIGYPVSIKLRRKTT